MRARTASSRLPRLAALAALVTLAVSSVGCMTTYDAAGRPVQTVDPAVAVAGAAAAGLIGYAIANDDHHHYHGGGYYYRPYYRRGYYNPYCY